MQTLRAQMIEFIRDERGATAIEYSFIATLVSLAIIAGATMIGDRLKTLFETTAAGFKS
ncbi:pilus assembly protein Flp/PilA [Bosea sp. OAE506]|uniref:Flp family type IVb pilin n=1 Tax=Bosea sp. OAE506 TaxID=2663870 RepID=UPI00178B54B8